VAELSLTALSPLGGYERQFGNALLRENTDLAIVAVSIPRGSAAQIAEAVTQAYQCDMPATGQSVLSQDGKTRLLGMAADQFFVIYAYDGLDAVQQVSKALNGQGYFVDQSHNWVALTLSGPLCRAALERICPINLHPEKFPLNAMARTQMEHLSAVVVRTEPDGFLLLSPSSSAQSFLHAVETSLRYVS